MNPKFVVHLPLQHIQLFSIQFQQQDAEMLKGKPVLV